MSDTVTNETLDAEKITVLAEKFGTPLYIYDGDRFRQQYQSLKANLPQNFEVFYAVKANPLAGILQIFKQLGSGAEVASEGEMFLALRAGFHPRNIIYTCPGKTQAGIEMAIKNDIYSINIESVQEAELINFLAEKYQKQHVPISIRINPNFAVVNAKLTMTGLPSQFGIDEDNLGDFFEFVNSRFSRLSLIGVHVYSGTQILRAEDIVSNADQIFGLAIRLAEQFDFNLKFLDIGGGFGISYADTDIELNLSVLKNGYQDIWEKYMSALEGVRVVVESGRFLTAEGGVFITRVLDEKISKGKNFIICDGGYGSHPASTFIDKYHQNRFPVVPVIAATQKKQVTVVGPTGTPSDILANDIWMETVAPGDFLKVTKSGAYGYTNSCQLFFSNPSPAEVMLLNGQTCVLRKRGGPESIMNGQENVVFS